MFTFDLRTGHWHANNPTTEKAPPIPAALLT
jgi:hypothetical protein